MPNIVRGDIPSLVNLNLEYLPVICSEVSGVINLPRSISIFCVLKTGVVKVVLANALSTI